MLQGPLVLLGDVETTGLDPHRDRVIDMAFVLTDFHAVYAVLSTYVNPLFDFARSPTGIEYTEVVQARAPSFSELAPFAHGLLALADEHVFYNHRFDLSFLQAELARSELRLPRRITRDPFTALRCSLREACLRYAISVDDIDWHNAIGDAVALFRLERKLRASAPSAPAPGDAPTTFGPRFA